MDLQALHPDANYCPYHHLAMHLPHFFCLFWPACCFWTYPFEQVIGQNQHILSNHWQGQMESTLLHSFLKSSKIKRWLSNPDQPPAICEIKSLFDNIYTSNSDEDGNSEGIDEHEWFHNKLLGNSIPFKLLTLSHLQSEISLWARFKHQGVVFATNHTHQGNSQIYFYPGGNTKLAPVPGFIKYIYTEQAMPNNILFAIWMAIPNNNDFPDPFLRYKHWPARQYSHAQLSCVQVHLEWIYS